MTINHLDMSAVFNNALGTVAAHRGMQQQQEYRNFLRDNGEALMAGDPGALAGYAQYDLGGALSMRNSMNSERRADARFQQEMQILAGKMSAQERVQELQKVRMGIQAGSSARTPEEWDATVGQISPGLLGQFENRDSLIRRAMSWEQFLTTQAPKEPLSAPGKVQADIDAGILPSGTPLREPKATSERIRKIADAQRLYGMDEGTATALVDGHIKVVPDQLGGYNVVDSRALARGEQPAPKQPAPLGFAPTLDLPGAQDSFGIEGAAKGVANTVVDAVGLDAPFPDVQEAQSDFGVLKEDILSDLANGYRRQPPSWVLKALDDLTPKAGRPFEGAGKAQSKLRALERKFDREIALMERQLDRRMKPTDRAETEGQLTSLRMAKERVSGMLGAFGTSQGNTTKSGINWSVK